MPIDQVGPFIVVAVSAEDQVDAVILQDGNDVGPHLDHVAVVVEGVVGVVGSFRVRRAVPEGD